MKLLWGCHCVHVALRRYQTHTICSVRLLFLLHCHINFAFTCHVHAMLHWLYTVFSDPLELTLMTMPGNKQPYQMYKYTTTVSFLCFSAMWLTWLHYKCIPSSWHLKENFLEENPHPSGRGGASSLCTSFCKENWSENRRRYCGKSVILSSYV